MSTGRSPTSMSGPGEGRPTRGESTVVAPVVGGAASLASAAKANGWASGRGMDDGMRTSGCVDVSTVGGRPDPHPDALTTEPFELALQKCLSSLGLRAVNLTIAPLQDVEHEPDVSTAWVRQVGSDEFSCDDGRCWYKAVRRDTLATARDAGVAALRRG